MMRDRHGAQTILVDGAINRIAIATARLAQGVIVATGAAVGPLADLVAQTRHQVAVLGAPRVDDRIEEVCARHPDAAFVIGRGAEATATSDEPLLQCLDGVRTLVPPGAEWLYTAGAASDAVLELLAGVARDLVLVVDDASKISISEKTHAAWRARGCSLAVRHPIDVVAVTCNPHAPVGEGLDPAELLARLRAAIDLPVHDVVWESGQKGGRTE
jgi:hypothetical protein